jgi:hypothetical protein
MTSVLSIRISSVYLFLHRNSRNVADSDCQCFVLCPLDSMFGSRRHCCPFLRSMNYAYMFPFEEPWEQDNNLSLSPNILSRHNCVLEVGVILNVLCLLYRFFVEERNHLSLLPSAPESPPSSHHLLRKTSLASRLLRRALQTRSVFMEVSELFKRLTISVDAQKFPLCS